MTAHGGRRLMWGLTIPGVCLVLAFELIQWLPLLFVGAGLMMAGIIVLGIFWRCPDCRKFLGMNHVDYCPHCGHALGEWE